MANCSNKTVIRKWYHLIADVVTTNSHTNRLMLEAMVPFLNSRIFTIYNAVDLVKFKPRRPVFNTGLVRLVVAARFNEQKNILRAIEAIDFVRQRIKDISVSVDWFGHTIDNKSLWRKSISLLRLGYIASYLKESGHDVEIDNADK